MHSPGYNAQEMIKAFNRVLGTSSSSAQAVETQKKASECKTLVDAHWARMANGRKGRDGQRLEGRDFAALKILELARQS